MTQLADELEQFEGSDALGNGDFSVCLRAAAALRAKPAGEVVDGAAAFAHSFVLLNSGNVELAEGVRDYILARTRPAAEGVREALELDTGLAGRIQALGHDCENTDGWEGAASDCFAAAKTLAALADQPASDAPERGR